jgi:hypothetical protein
MAENFIDVFDDKKKSSNFVDVFEQEKPFKDVFEKTQLEPSKGLIDSMLNLYKKADEIKETEAAKPVDSEPKTKPVIDVTYNPYKDYDKNFIKQLKNVTVGAARDTAQGSIDVLNFLLPGDPLKNVKLPQVEEPSNLGLSIARDLLGFAVPYAGLSKLQAITKIPQATTKVGKIAQVTTKGGFAEQLAFSPYEQRLSNLVDQYPSLQNPVTDYLKADNEDDEFTARQKMFMEGAILGIPFELLGVALGRGKVNKFVEPSKEADTVTKSVMKAEADNVSPNTIYSQKEQIEGIEKIDVTPKSKEELLNIQAPKFEKTQVDIEQVLGAKPRTLEGVDLPQAITRPAIKQEVNQNVLNAAEQLLLSGKVRRNPNLRLNEQIADLIVTGRIDDQAFTKILKDNKIQLDEFARYFGADKSDAGRTLQSLSIIQSKINKLNKVPNGNTAYDQAVSASGADEFVPTTGRWRRADNIRRGLLTGQVATAVRNFQAAIGRVGVDVLEKGLDVALRSAYRSMSGGAMPKKSLSNPMTSFEGFLSIFRQIDPKNYKLVKEQTNNILASFPKEQDRLFLRYSSDIVERSGGKDLLGKGEKAVHLVNFFNRLQEYIVRRAVFQSSLDELIRNNPKHYSNRKLAQIIADNDLNIFKQEDIAAAVEKALEVTFAKNFNQGKGIYEGIADYFIKLINRLPFTASLAIPFPRFIMNSLKFHAEYSPLGFFRYFSDGERQAFAKGNTAGMSKAIIGSGMLLAAYNLRHQPYAGEKWYEFKIGNRTIDFRPFNPFAAYLFVADAMKRTKEGTLSNLDLKGFVNVFTGVRGGTGLYLIDRFIDGVTGVNPNVDLAKEINKIAGETIGGLFVPLQTAQDAIAQFYPEMAIVKDASGNPIKDNIQKRLPLNNNLPPVVSSTSVIFDENGIPRAAPIKREEPLARQLTGVSVISAKNSAEKELDRLGIPARRIFQSTGIPELDVAYKNALAPQIAIALSKIVEAPAYQQQTNARKIFIVEQVLNDFRKNATEAIQNNEGLAPFILKYEIEKIPLSQRRILDETLGKDYLKELIRNYVK